ncbi:MAG: NADPH-dependent glutamate synthase [bacterium]|nr:NADPH-dependent glutamate synthase [bacterium]
MQMQKRLLMPEQLPQERIKNFNEVALGYTDDQAIAEAKRCLQCKKAPCMAGCPVEIDIPGFIELVAERKFPEALTILREKNNLPAICGRVCPQETQCEIVCTLKKKSEPVAIGRLERFVADWGRKNRRQTTERKEQRAEGRPRAAVIGAGPAGLTCAGDLARMSWKVTIFESLHAPGGVLRYGIPEFRMPRDVLDYEIEYVKNLGVEIKTNIIIGRTITIEELFDAGYKAVFIGTGAGFPYFLGIPGENYNGVYSANEFLTRANLMKAYRFPEYDTPIKIGVKVAVVGAGNVAMDSARVARRLGAKKVCIIYRRSRSEMPARAEEIHHAEEEGIELDLLTLPIEIIGDEKGWVKQVKCLKMKLGEPDDTGRRRPLPIDGSEYLVDIDTVVIAIGQGPNPLLLSMTPGLKLTRKGNIVADNITGETSLEGVYAGGDIVTGAATVIEAMGAGKRAARAIDNSVNSKHKARNTKQY